MIVTLNDTTTREISARLEQLHVERGEAAQERVMTLIITCAEPDLETALRTANETSQEHPCRVIAVVPEDGTGSDGSAGSDSSDGGEEHHTLLSAEIRFGADAGASEIIVLRPKGDLTRHLDSLLIPLMVPDTPAVAWWPRTPPVNPAHDQIGRMATERITDAAQTPDPLGTFEQLRQVSTPADVDLSWTHLTLWRARLAAMLDLPPHEKIGSVTVTGGKDNLSVLLLAAWLHQMLGSQVEIDWDPGIQGIFSVAFHRTDGDLTLTRCRRACTAHTAAHTADGAKNGSGLDAGEPGVGATETGNDEVASSEQSDQAWMISPDGTKQLVSLPHRSMTDILSEELGRLYPDEVYAEVLRSDFSFRQRTISVPEQTVPAAKQPKAQGPKDHDPEAKDPKDHGHQGQTDKEADRG